MQDWREQYLGLATFPTSLSAIEIDELFAFDDDSIQMVGVRRTSLTRLGLVLQIRWAPPTTR